MVVSTTVLGIGIAALLLLMMGTILPTTSVFAADINCANVVPPCVGTTGDDRMAGGKAMDGNQGNDQISGTDSPDRICGGAGNDKITGGSASDALYGDRGALNCPSTGGSTGADIISGGAGEKDEIFHGDFGATEEERKAPDGHKDIIDCGPGVSDTATINISVDHDIATNCETVIAG